MASTLYLDHRDLELSLQGQALIIHRDGKYQRSIPLGLLERVVCRAGVTLKTSLLVSLTHAGIGVSLFGGRKGRYAAHLGPGGTQDVQRRLGQYRQYLDSTARFQWSLRLVSHKLLRQRRFLQRALQRRPDRRLPLVKGIERMAGLGRRLREESFDNLESLRGIEGAAANQYFQAYAALIPEAFGFHGRNRRPPRDPVNALLSLGYTLLHGEVQNAIESVGLDPWLGVYHEPQHGRASLACDLAELYRQQVDELVWILSRSRALTQTHFGASDGACLLNKEGRAIFYPMYETHMRPLRRRLRGVVLRIARALQSS